MVTKSESNNNGGSIERNKKETCAPGSDSYNTCVRNAKELNKNTKNIDDTCEMCYTKCENETLESVQTLCTAVVNKSLERPPNFISYCGHDSLNYNICVTNAKELNKGTKNIFETCKKCFWNCPYGVPKSTQTLCSEVFNERMFS